ncbi:hypothetical protein BJ742DRAFT_737304 [Cladochytrium replicatum]|nr:hypothetical protein BJ742DRAFT_737304 [Cladochytrium replicatum]
MGNSDKDKDDFDVDTFLRMTASAVTQDAEIDRILSFTIKNPFDLLEVSSNTFATGTIDQREIKLQYRKKSILCHPDKSKNPRAQEAFEALKAAESYFTDDEKRETIVAILQEARDTVIRQKRITKRPSKAESESDSTTTAEIDPRMNEPAVIEAIRAEVRSMLKGNMDRASIRLKNEFERRAQEAEEQAETRKRKLEHDKAWENSRDDRVASWRKFVNKKKKK